MLSLIFQRKFQVIGILALISGVAGIYVYKKRKNQNNKKEQRAALITHISEGLNDSRTLEPLTRFQIQKCSSVFSQYYFDKNLQCRKVLDHLDNQGISVQTIYKYSPIIAVDQYNKFTKEIRKRRRLIRTVNEDQYIKIIMNYEAQIQELLQRSRQQIINDCQIDPQQFQNMKHVFQVTQDLQGLIKNAKNYLKQLSFTKKRQINKNIMQKIINQEMCFVKSKVYDRLRIKLQKDFEMSQDQILKVILALIDDIIYEKYGYERQQIQFSLQNRWSYELMKQIKQLKRIRQLLQSDIGNINLLSQESDAESQNQKNSPSQGLTRSGANSAFLQDQQDN